MNSLIVRHISKTIFAIAFFFAATGCFAQTLRFRLLYDQDLPAVNVKVLNIVTEETTVSDANGEFTIAAKPEEMLVFPAENFEYKRYLIEAEDLAKNPIVIRLLVRAIELDEVTVNRDINPEDLGLVPRGQKRMTVAERRVYSAQSGPVDLLVNALTGRTKMLKKAYANEKKERLREQLEYQFEEDIYVSTLHIPQDYIKDFQFYAVADETVVYALQTKNKPALLEALSPLVPKYLELIPLPQSGETQSRQ